MSRPGLTIILDAARRGSLVAGSPVYYRQVQVGEVTGFELGEWADRVYIYVHIEPQYRPLVREYTVFWNASGVDVNFGLKSGLNINTESAQALIKGELLLPHPSRHLWDSKWNPAATSRSILVRSPSGISGALR